MQVQIKFLTLCKEFLPNLKNINKPNKQNNTPLHVACSKGHFKIVRYLIDNGAEIDKRGQDDTTPLHVAINKGHKKIVLLLIAYGSDIEASVRHCKPLHIAAKRDFEDIVDILIGAGVDIHPGSETPLHVAVSSGSIKAALVLIQWGADIERLDNKQRTPRSCQP